MSATSIGRQERLVQLITSSVAEGNAATAATASSRESMQQAVDRPSATAALLALTEARLCREAEIAFASLSLVTDYDCWRDDEAGVDAAEILAVLQDNAHVAQDVLRAAIPLLPEGPLPENDVLRASMVTPAEWIPDDVRRRLGPILASFLGA